MPTYVNIHGRKMTRGLRPWLLIPKVLAVALYFGGVAAAAVVWWSSDWWRLAKDDPQRLLILDNINHIMVRLAVPALVLAMILGVGLTLLTGWRIMLLQRWMRVKLAFLLIFIPAAHFFMSSRALILRQAVHDGVEQHTAARQFSFGFVLVLIGTVLLIWLSRHKPRLGQPWGRVYKRLTRTNHATKGAKA